MDVYWWLANKRPTFRVEWEYKARNEASVTVKDEYRETFRLVVDASVLEDLEAEIRRFRERNGLIQEADANGAVNEADET